MLARAESEGRVQLLEHEVYELLASAGVGVPAHRFLHAPELADRPLCDALGSDEAVVKVVSPDIGHKSDVGGVAICANEPAAIREAAARVLASAQRLAPSARIRGALVAERVPYAAGSLAEALVGIRHDPAFGPVVVFGAGGLDAECLQQRFSPGSARAVRAAGGLTDAAARDVLSHVLAAQALMGRLRSAPHTGVAEESLVRCLLAFAWLAEELCGYEPGDGLGLAELEVNPLVGAADGRLVAVDGLARLHRPNPLPPARPLRHLQRLLRPESALLVGASADSTNVGRVILRNLIEGGGIPSSRLWLLHPRAGAIDGCRAFRSLADLPAGVDLAVVAAPASSETEQLVVDLVRSRRARAITLVSGGWGETERGRVAESRIRQALETSHRDADGGVLLNGGNCLGIISVPGGYSTFFIPDHKLRLRDAPGRNVASISQSGAYLVSQLSNLEGQLQPRYAISFGNQSDLTLADYMEHLEGDSQVEVFAVYLEGFRRGDGERFIAVARRLTRDGRAVLLFKAGRTPEGREAALSHTAAVVGDYDVCRDLSRAAGVVVCATLEAFEDDLTTFSLLAGRPAAGSRVAILSNAGFECSVAADALHGATLAELAPETLERLRRLLPQGVVDVHNPVDATPLTETERYAACAEVLLADAGVDALVVAGVPATPALETLAAGDGHSEDVARETSLASRLIRVFRSTRKPMSFSVDAGALYDPCVARMRHAGLPCFRKVDRAMRALATYLGACR